jgi:hypothetical protein
MNDYQTLFADGRLGKPTRAASERLIGVLESRLKQFVHINNSE